MSLETVLSHPTVERVGWTLVHFLWQGAALTAMFGVELALLRKSRAGVRYLAGCLILALMVLAPCLTMFMMPASESRSAVEPEAIVSIPAGASSADYAGPPEVSALGGPNPALAPSRQVAPPTVTAGPARPWKERAVVAMEPALPYLVLIWLAGVFGLSVWHLGGWAQLQRLRRRMVRPVEDRLHTKLHELAQVLGVRRAVALMESALVQVPTVVGWLKPVILLPASALTGLTSEQLEAILAHELAHIRRLDYLVNMLQTLAEILGFYHPAVWWVSHKIRIERENCCDDLVIGVTGDKLRYARALTLLEEMRAGSANLAVAADGGSLLGRIRRLVGKGSREEGRYSWLPAAITVLLILAIAVPTTIALSTSENKKADVKVEAAWGQAADGVQARIWVDEHVWPENEVPRVLKLELRNRGTRKLGLAPNLSWAPTELEVDGHWYYNSETTMLSRAGPFAFGPQAELRDGSLPIRDSDWRSKKDDRTLKLMPGKRRIRVAFVAQPEDSGGPVRFVSNPVQIEILPVTAEAVEAEVSEVVKVIRLKYADPEDLSEHLNATFNEPGAGSATRLDEISNVTGRVRFIPNPRAKTILVLCPAESMGSIEEMIKEVDRPGPGIQVRKFSATLSNGVTVELVGICEHPSEEKQWWRPDGGILQERPYERLHDMEAYGDLRLFEVVYRVQPGKGVQSRIDRTEAIPGSFGPYPIERETEGVSEFAKDSLYAYVPVKDGLDRIDLPVLCGTERGWQWHARIESPVDHAGMNTDKVNLSARAGKGDRTIAFVTHRIFDEELRVIAKDKSGQIHKPVSDKRKAMTWAGSITAEFDLPVTEVASIEVQTQKFDKVVFGNVSLKPGAKTEVEVEIVGARPGALEQTVLPKGAEKTDEKTRREQIEQRLQALEEHRVRIQRDLDAAESSLEDVRAASGLTGLESPTQQHPITLKHNQMELERDNLILQLKQYEAQLRNLQDRSHEYMSEEAERQINNDRVVSTLKMHLVDLENALAHKLAKYGKDHEEVRKSEEAIEVIKERVQSRKTEIAEQIRLQNLLTAQDQLIVLRSRLEEVEKLRTEAEAKQKELEAARAQYERRLAIRDERSRMLDSIKESIEKLKIIYSDPEIGETQARADEDRDEGQPRLEPGRLSREKIREKLANLENRKQNIQRELAVTEDGLQELREVTGFSDLEQRSYPHPVTQRLIRLERQRDDCVLEGAQLQAQIDNLEKQADTAEGKARLRKAQDNYVVLSSKLKELQRMCDEARAQKKDLDSARSQYQRRLAVRDERQRMLDSIKAEITRLRILHDDPDTPSGEEEAGRR